jgi:hypothetical protein
MRKRIVFDARKLRTGFEGDGPKKRTIVEAPGANAFDRRRNTSHANDRVLVEGIRSGSGPQFSNTKNNPGSADETSREKPWEKPRRKTPHSVLVRTVLESVGFNWIETSAMKHSAWAGIGSGGFPIHERTSTIENVSIYRPNRSADQDVTSHFIRRTESEECN